MTHLTSRLPAQQGRFLSIYVWLERNSQNRVFSKKVLSKSCQLVMPKSCQPVIPQTEAAITSWHDSWWSKYLLDMSNASHSAF